MAKTIKFNLLVDENPIRDIKGLQENFCIEDILEVYENGLLEKWLKVRGFDEYLEQIQNLDREQSIIIQLIKIFDIKKDDSEIKKAIYSLEFKEQRKRDIEQFKKSKGDIENFIEQYHKGYSDLIEETIKQKENMPFLKEASKEISDKYLKLFELNYKDLYQELKEKTPLMIYAILMNNRLRDWFIDHVEISQDLFKKFLLKSKLCSECKGTGFVNSYIKRTKFTIPTDVECTKCNGKGIINDNRFSNIIERFIGITDGYWKNLEIKNTKVIILFIPNGTLISTPNNPKKEYSSEEVNGNFLILDGLLYKSNNDLESIVYMKV